MSVHGSYRLRVFCDDPAESCAGSWTGVEYVGATVQEAVRKARAAGWMIRADKSSSGARKRKHGVYTGTASCPECVRRKKET